MGIPEKIKKIEDDIHRTQVNKKTEHHIGLLRGKLAKLRQEQEEQQCQALRERHRIRRQEVRRRDRRPDRSAQRRQVDPAQQADQRQIEGRGVRVHDPRCGPRRHGLQGGEDTGTRPPRDHPGSILRQRSREEGPGRGKERRPRALHHRRLPARSEERSSRRSSRRPASGSTSGPRTSS